MSQSYVTLYNLSGQDLTINNSVSSVTSPPLSSDYWGPTSAQSPGALPSLSPTPTATLMFSRDQGITYDDAWDICSSCVVDGVTVQLDVQLRGTPAGSDMQLCITAGENTTGFWSTNDTQTLQFTGQSGTNYSVQVSLYVRIPYLVYADLSMTISKYVLNPGQQLNVGDRLNSPNGLMTLIMQEQGLVLSRSMYNDVIWASPNPNGMTANYAIMDAASGNLIIYDISGAIVTEVGTSVPGNIAVLADNGFLVFTAPGIYAPLAAYGAEQDWTAPTYQYTENGYAFDETSENWKQLCQNLPCSLAIQWPDYATNIFETTLMGQPAVIQVWRGYCEQILGSHLPGGIGAEVGVYTRQPVITLPGVSSDQGDAPDGSQWWPAPWLVESISFQLINLDNGGSVFFESQAENTYWNCKWMSPDSYSNYQNSLPSGNTPPDSDRYQLNFQVNGQPFTWPGTT